MKKKKVEEKSSGRLVIRAEITLDNSQTQDMSRKDVEAFAETLADVANLSALVENADFVVEEED